MAVEITKLLEHAQSPDAALRNQAEQQLKQFEEQNAVAYLTALATELASSHKPAGARQIAGLILKNALDAADETKKATLVARWQAMDDAAKQHIMRALLATLPSDLPAARHTAALVIAKVAAIELPLGGWRELIGTLLDNMSATPPNSGLQQATLQALGYVCEEMGYLADDVLNQEQINSILTAVVQGMRKEEQDNDVRLAATKALYNAIEFASTNFRNETERNYLMQVICEAATGATPALRESAYECMVKIVPNYYDTLPPYMETIFSLTKHAIEKDEEEVAKQAIEFWSSICEEEIDLIDDAEDSNEDKCHYFVKTALQPLVEVLLGQLTKQEEGQDLDDNIWNVSMASGTALSLVAQTVRDDVVPLAMPYVQANIQKNAGEEDWRCREAATFVFGCILEGPSVTQLAQIVGTGLQFLLTATKDRSTQVRLTTMWTIGRIFEFVHGAEDGPPVITPANLPAIVSVLQESILDEPHVAEKVCYAYSQVAAGFGPSDDGTSPLSPYFKDIVTSLLAAADRPSGGMRLQTAAFEAINELVRQATNDTLPLVVQLVPVFIQRLSSTLQMQAAAADASERQSEIQGLLCGVLQVIVQKLSEQESTKAGILQFADQIMEVLLQVFACRSVTVHEEALLAVGSVTYASGKQFIKYMERFFPVLEQGLSNHQEWQVCQSSVGVLSDISRAIEDQLFPYCNRIMHILLENLQSNEVNRNVKPHIISAFGDIALAIGDKFEYYITHVVSMLQSAQAMSVQQQQTRDEDLFDFNNQLRHGIFEAYAGIINGMSPEKVNQYLLEPSPMLLEFIEYVAADKENMDPAVLKAAVSLLGDLAHNVQNIGQLLRQKAFITPFLQECQQVSDDGDDLATSAAWAGQAIAKATH